MWRAVWNSWRRWRTGAGDDPQGVDSSSGSSLPLPLVGQDLQGGSNNLQVGTANDVTSTTLRAGSGSVQIQAGGNVHVVHITVAQQQLDADAVVAEALKQAPVTSEPSPAPQVVAQTEIRRRLTPSQRALLLSIRKLPLEKEAAIFDFMAEKLGTRLVRDLDDLGERRLTGYLKTTWSRLENEHPAVRRWR